MQWLDPVWVVDQFRDGDGLPFILWTAITLTSGFAVGFFVNKKLAGWVPKRVVAKGFSPEIKRAALESLDSPGSVVMGDKFESILAFEREELMRKTANSTSTANRAAIQLDTCIVRVSKNWFVVVGTYQK